MFVISVCNVLLIGVYWFVSALFLYTDLTGRPSWMAYYKVQQNTPPVSYTSTN